ncbi:helix-turn-helix domain-containing protein [Rhodococcus sp. LW-XY12]|uniref:helix-turn-helix domain-containing protein n=1 Tax=Rhodococcus sp. LW-XY12 TaxID=2856851 RepID=UPI001C59CAB9|nr:helix-turn-helix domain-containing protein [Rhodococcus sp. LW-XY12]QXU53626.1 helix-turn-helix domain-containing protein [Rhodococcus sp. LW-XY12]
MSADPWPWPADTQLDRARRIAQSYREALLALDAAKCMNLDDRARELGQAWVVPELVTIDENEMLSATDAAALVGVNRSTLYRWVDAGHLVAIYRTNKQRPLFRSGDVLNAAAVQRRRRAARAAR